MRKSYWLHPIALCFYCAAAFASYYIPDSGVTTAKIAANAVTTAKLGIAGGSTAAVGYPFSGDANTGIYSPAADKIAFVTGGTERMRISDDGSQSSAIAGSSTLLPLYGVRAFAKIDQTTNVNLTGTYARSGTTVTAAVTAHGMKVGQWVYMDFTTGAATDGGFVITSVADADHFTITHGSSGTTSGNVTLKRHAFVGKNVTFVADAGTGNSVVNFDTAMPDANYGVTLSGCISGSGTYYVGAAMGTAGASFDAALPSPLNAAAYFGFMNQTSGGGSLDCNGHYVTVFE